MYSLFKKIAITLVAFSSLSMTAHAQMHADKDVVIDTNGHVIHNTFGNCVRTKWVAGEDACGKKQAAKPSPAKPSTKVTKQETPKALMPRSRSYIVFFDWDKSSLTEESKDILRKAVRDSKDRDATSFDVTGHADRSGSSSYNLGLSQRRADTVKRYLSDLGVKSKDINAQYKGESTPLVPTEDGVREPQNRRVEIIYYYVR